MNRLISSRLPLAAAPMAGGPTGPDLTAAAARAGAFPFIAGGYKTPEALRGEIDAARTLGVDFGVNLFVPEGRSPDRAAFRAYAAELQPEADAYGLTLSPDPVLDDDHWSAKLQLLTEHPVPVVSMTFGIPDPADIAALQDAGSRVLISVTSSEEAESARSAGADGLVIQGPQAGGHSAVHDPRRTPEPAETPDAVRQIRSRVPLPVIGAGGVDGPDAARRILDAGAEGVVVGTLLLRTDEAGTSPTHRAALSDPKFEETVLTRAFTGRPARALRSRFIDRHHDTAPTAYPALHHLTKPIRAAAGSAGDAQRLHLWAGTGWRSAPEALRHVSLNGWPKARTDRKEPVRTER